MLRAAITTLAAFVPAFVLAFAATVVEAQSDAPAGAGSIVSMEGTVEIGRAGSFAAASVGSAVNAGDTIRTGTPGRARILFNDESVLNVGDASTLVIDETVYDPNKGAGSTFINLLGGKVRALVSDYYSGGQASYEIQSTTAVSGVRGTEFVMAYNPKTQLTEVLGLGGEVAVHGTIDRARKRGVLVHSNELTEIAKGKYPTPPRQVSNDDEAYQRLMAGLDLPGSGGPESLVLADPVLGNKDVPAPDTADGTVSVFPIGGTTTEGGTTGGQPGDGIFGPGGDLPPSEPGHTAGDILEQPAPVLDAGSDIDIHF